VHKNCAQHLRSSLAARFVCAHRQQYHSSPSHATDHSYPRGMQTEMDVVPDATTRAEGRTTDDIRPTPFFLQSNLCLARHVGQQMALSQNGHCTVALTSFFLDRRFPLLFALSTTANSHLPPLPPQRCSLRFSCAPASVTRPMSSRRIGSAVGLLKSQSFRCQLLPQSRGAKIVILFFLLYTMDSIRSCASRRRHMLGGLDGPRIPAVGQRNTHSDD
jgi:hypothetical protein